jgi:hypothetical protein
MSPSHESAEPTIDFAYLKGLVWAVLESLDAYLQREPRPPGPFSGFLRRHLKVSWQLFRGAILLVSEVLEKRGEPRLPLPAAILSRSMLDSYANVMCLCEAPSMRTPLYSLDVLRARVERFQALRARGGARPERADGMRRWEAELQQLATRLGRSLT